MSLCLDAYGSQSLYWPPPLTLSNSPPKTEPIGQREPMEKALHQFPYRSFAFASDLGTVAHIVKQPKLAGIGWMIAAPYYLYSILAQPNKEKREQETVYQLTANGIFPLLEAKLGAIAGQQAGLHLLSSLPEKTFSWLHKARPATWKGLGSLVALVTLTPTLGDPLSKKILNKFNQLKGVTC